MAPALSALVAPCCFSELLIFNNQVFRGKQMHQVNKYMYIYIYTHVYIYTLVFKP